MRSDCVTWLISMLDILTPNLCVRWIRIFFLPPVCEHPLFPSPFLLYVNIMGVRGDVTCQPPFSDISRPIEHRQERAGLCRATLSKISPKIYVAPFDPLSRSKRRFDAFLGSQRDGCTGKRVFDSVIISLLEEMNAQRVPL